MWQRSIVMAVAVLALTSIAFGQRGQLQPGSPAPGLSIDTWVKGESTSLRQGHVYIVEFWATWCGPCRRAIPHLSDLQRQYEGDLTIVAISDEKVETVDSFVRTQGARMNYTVAVDSGRSTQRAWMDAARMRGIPAAFIVDRRGTIAWMGRPFDDEFDEVVRLVVLDRYDPEALSQARPLIEAADRARQVRNWSMALRHLERAVAINPRVLYKEALKRFEIMISDMNDPQQAYEYAAGEFLAMYGSDVTALTELAEMIATSPRIRDEHRSFEVALVLAEAAKAQAEDRYKPVALAGLARVYHAKGEFEKAVDYQRQAFFVARPMEKPRYRETLDRYREAQRRAEAMGRN